MGVDFSVGARDFGEARALVEQALQGENPDGLPLVARDRLTLDDDRRWGVLDWDQVPPRPSQAALMQGQYPGLVNDAAAMEMLQALLRAGDRPVVVSELIPEATRERVAQIVDDLNRDVLVDDPDAPGRLVYDGPANQAATYLAEGTYRAFDEDDREYALVVAPSELAPAGRVSQAIPRDRHDSRTLDEIAALLHEHRPDQSLEDLFRQVNCRLETTRRPGFPSWMPLDATPDPEPAPEAEPEHAPEQSPAPVYVGVILWTDLEDQYPTVYVESDPERLSERLATSVHDELVEDADAFAGAGEFLDRHPLPLRKLQPGEADAWLDALHESTPYPAVTIHRLNLGKPSPEAAPAVTRAAEAAPVEAAPDSAIQQEAGAEQPLFTYDVPVDFSVSARTADEARRMVDDALAGGAAPATPAMVQRGQQLRPDGDVEGVLGWQHHDEAVSRAPAVEADPVAVVLEERARGLDPATDSPEASAGAPGREREAREPK